jgi:hypothetical protein
VRARTIILSVLAEGETPQWPPVRKRKIHRIDARAAPRLTCIQERDEIARAMASTSTLVRF